MRTIPDPIASILPPLVDDLRSTLGGDLVGIYLYGSAISGGFEPNASDLDLVIVTERDAGDLDLGALDTIHARLAAREPDWADRLDIAYVGRSTLATFRSGGPVVSISHDEPLRRYDDADGWLQTWHLVCESDAPIVGPPPGELIPPIEPAEFVRAVARDAARVVGLVATDARSGPLTYTLVTLCRVLVALDGGGVVSKQEAVEVIARRRPHARWLLDACLRVRHERGRLPLTPAEQLAVPSLIAELAAEIRERSDTV